MSPVRKFARNLSRRIFKSRDRARKFFKRTVVKSSVRTRIAPSPTGPLHLGTARTALFNFIYARQNKGVFVLRVEDTDIGRSDMVFERDIKKSLEWLGIKWDEFYRQSDRLDTYEKYLKKLLDSGSVFWCPHSTDELALERREQISRKEALRHLCEFRDGSSSEDGKSILRFKNDTEGDITFDDLVRGKISFEGSILGDFSVAKDLRTPLYNFAVVVDDYEMKISHVIRGEDHISNTPRQIILQEALNFSRPKYAHLPLILGKDKSKLSKRHGATSVLEYKKAGYLADAMTNFMILLGWHPAPDKEGEEKEIFNIAEIKKEFSLDRVQKGGAIFNVDKLKWLNRFYIKKTETKDLAEMLKQFASSSLFKKIEPDPKKWLSVVSLAKDRLTTLGEIGEMAEYFYEEPYYSKELLFWKEKQPVDDILRHLKHIRGILSDIAKWDEKGLEKGIMPYAEKEGRGDVLWPLRAAFSGKRASAGPFEIAEIIGKEESLKRIEKAIKMLE